MKLDDPDSALIPESEALDFVRANSKIQFVEVSDVKLLHDFDGTKRDAAVADAICAVVAL